MLRKGQLTSDPGVGGGELGLEDCPIGLRRLQFGGKELRPDSLLGIILPSFILLAKELANVLLGALGNTRKRDPSELEEPEEASSLYRKEAKKLEIEIEQKHGNPKTEGRGAYSMWRRITGGALEGPSSGRLEPAIATGRPRVFAEERREEAL